VELSIHIYSSYDMDLIGVHRIMQRLRQQKKIHSINIMSSRMFVRTDQPCIELSIIQEKISRLLLVG